MDKALDDIVNSSKSKKVKMTEFKARVQFTYTMFIEHFDDYLGYDCESKTEANEFLDERIKAQEVIDWVTALPIDHDLGDAIAEFHAMPKPEGDPFATG